MLDASLRSRSLIWGHAARGSMVGTDVHPAKLTICRLAAKPIPCSDVKVVLPVKSCQLGHFLF